MPKRLDIQTETGGCLRVPSSALLEAELNRLKKITGVGKPLKFLWVPYEDSDKHGEVKGVNLIIYDVDEETALNTLRHEFFDYVISSEVVKPLIKIINVQKRIIDELIYERKEGLVEIMVDLFTNE